jgi:putative transposase
MVTYLMEFRRVSISRACQVVKLPKSMYYCKNVRNNSETIDELLEFFERQYICI